MGVKTIYLAGTSKKGNSFALEWRKEATQKLNRMDISTINPFRNKVITQDGELYTPNEIITRDLWDIRRSDLVLAEMTQDDCAYIGTSMEIIAASKFYDKPVVVWASDKIATHYWIRALAVHISNDLDECIEYIGGMWAS